MSTKPTAPDEARDSVKRALWLTVVLVALWVFLWAAESLHQEAIDSQQQQSSPESSP